MNSPIPAFLPRDIPKDQPYICPHCQKEFFSFRTPSNAKYIVAPIREGLTLNNTRSTCGQYPCWMAEVDEHSEKRIAYFSGIKRRKVAEAAPVEDPWDSPLR